MTDEAKQALVARQVAAIKGFYIHLVVFTLVMALLLTINVASGADWWAQWPFLGWGVGVLGHAFAVFGQAPGALARWEQRKAEELRHRLETVDPETPSAPKHHGVAATGPPATDPAAR